MIAPGPKDGLGELPDDRLLPTEDPAAPVEADDQESEVARPANESPTAETVRVIMTAIKFFIGSGVLFLAKAFANGGWVFSTVVMVGMAALTQLTILRLIECRSKVKGSFSHLGYVCYGNWAKYAVDASLIGAQGGFCCVYVAFIARNVLQLLNVNKCWVGTEWLWLLVLLQLPVFVPLSWIWRISSLAPTSTLANGIIFSCLGGILIWSWATWGTSHVTGIPYAVSFNSRDFPLFLGTAVYAYEGLGLIVPLYDSISPQGQKRFPRTIALTMVVVASIYTSVGLFPYLSVVGANGGTMQDSVTLNLPRAWWSYAIIALYCLALVFTFPLQLFPVLRIVERGLTGFGISSASDKHLPLKRCVRAGVVALVLLISYVGSGQLNNLVSLVGCFTCTPLAFIFPCLFHLKLVPQTSLWVRVSNWAIVALGLAVFGFSTYESIATWGETVVQPCLLTPGDS